MKKAIFFFRNGGIIVTKISSCDNGRNIGQRMCYDGFVVGADSLRGEKREVAINLADVSSVIITEEDHNNN